MSKSKAGKKRKVVAKRVTGKRAAPKRVAKKAVHRAAPKKRQRRVQPVTQEPQTHAATAAERDTEHAAPPQAGAHLDAPSAFQHPAAGQSSGAVKSDARVQR